MKANQDDLVAPNDPILIQIAKPIPVSQISSPETKKDIEKILDFSFGNRKDRSKPLVVGLAAPQVGISKRIIAVDTGANGKGGLSHLQVYINPKITYRSPKQEEWYEGCWSTGNVCGIVSRPKSITVEGFTPEGKPIKETYTGYVARIFQHETDHLNGKEFVTHIKDDSKLHWVKDDEFPKYRDQEAWRTWPNKCPRKRWEKIKGIKKNKSQKRLLKSYLKLNNDKERCPGEVNQG